MTLEDTWPAFRCKPRVISRLAPFTCESAAGWSCSVHEERQRIVTEDITDKRKKKESTADEK